MTRAIALIALMATPLAAQEEDKEQHCQITSEVVRAGVAERLGGADEETAIGAVEEALPDEQAKFRPAVAPIRSVDLWARGRRSGQGYPRLLSQSLSRAIGGLERSSAGFGVVSAWESILNSRTSPGTGSSRFRWLHQRR